ncbi:MAG TPA: class I SAM-dependent methyltransferase [Candidatus Eisenbacteria bacterium]|jgi:ubiquinone/menaquinone biosynthesis C-methylase UbiE|nr:class I SAM-dependent methyltransferase [Candidatus Eisenbacteria bacterium]
MREFQKKYYEETAAQYDRMHLEHGDEHYRALDRVEAFARERGLRSFLDVGCGTGRAVERLLKDGFDARGLDASEALLARAREKGIPAERLILGDAETLPFADGSFDAVCSFGLLHHVPDPGRVVREMTRVARRAVFLSDSNRFGQGRYAVRIVKLLLYRAGLWPAANFLKNGGKTFSITEGDGLSYSYSVYDSRPALARWGAEVRILSTDAASDRRDPLLHATHALAVAFRRDR